jgi:lipoprotein-anchoring transpeptidase ErfK/SrfK
VAGVRALIALATLALVPGAAHGAVVIDGEPLPTPPTDRQAWTATILAPVPARAEPRASARVVRRLSGQTPFSKRTEVLLVTGARQVGRRQWVQVQLPSRPNGVTGWVPADATILSPTPVRIRIRLGAKRVEVYRAGRRVGSYRAAVGKPSTPTPVGRFAVYDPVPTDGQLAPVIMVLTAYSPVLQSFLGGTGVSAIHGWPDPGVMGQAVSAGCIRLSQRDTARVARVAEPGTPVTIDRT